MYRKALFVFVCAACFAAGAERASAQTVQDWLDRGYFNVNAGFGSTSGTLNDATTFRLYDETGTRRVTQPVDGGPFFDFSVGTRVWRNASVGLGYHRGSSSNNATVEATVPHPLFFNSLRAVSLATGDLNRTESAVHLQFGYMLPLSDRLSVHVTAGPSFFRLKQDVVSDVTFSEAAPFTTVNATPVVTERSDSAAGINVGADVSYLFYEAYDVKVGGGMFVRYSGATAEIPVLANTAETDLGGLQIGFGARVRF